VQEPMREKGTSLLWAAVGGLASAIATAMIVAHNVPSHGGDFSVYWGAARYLFSGDNPYRHAFLYPMPTLLILLPLTWLPVRDGAIAFMALSVALMTFGLLRTFGWSSLVFVLSPAFWDAIWKLQWGPLLVAAALVAPLGFLAAGKATVGLAALAYRPNKWAIGGFVAMVALSFILLPTWPWDIVPALPSAPAPHDPPVRWWTGAVGLLGLLRWREPRGRVLAACTLIPASAQLYDHLLVWLATRDWRESLALTATAWIGYIAFLATAPHDLTKDATAAQLSIAASVYVPAGLMMLLPWRRGERSQSAQSK